MGDLNSGTDLDNMDPIQTCTDLTDAEAIQTCTDFTDAEAIQTCSDGILELDSIYRLYFGYMD